MNNEDRFNFTIEPWQTTGERAEYTTNIFELLSRDMLLESEDHRATFSILKAPDWINVIPLTNKNEIVLVEQYRYGIEDPTLELPGGMVDPGEDPLGTSKRELLEETGYAGEEWIDLGKVSSNPAILTNWTHTFLAKGCTKKTEQKLDGNERINIHLLPLQVFIDQIREGSVHHSLVVAGMMKYFLSEHYTNQ